jgi:hypothetical protein
MNPKPSRRQCRHCDKVFSPDHRNLYHQYFCSDPDCRRASKAASQRRWLRQTQNRDYFRGPEQSRRVQEWRKSNPGYWRKKPATPQSRQVTESQPAKQLQASCNVANGLVGALQDFCLARNPLFIGLLSVVTGSTLQEDIVTTMDQLLIRGRKIMGLVLPDQRHLKTMS